jgi:hypothetical protein
VAEHLCREDVIALIHLLRAVHKLANRCDDEVKASKTRASVGKVWRAAFPEPCFSLAPIMMLEVMRKHRGADDDLLVEQFAKGYFVEGVSDPSKFKKRLDGEEETEAGGSP